MRKKIAIIGATGLLGSSVYSALKDEADLLLIYRSEKKLGLLLSVYGNSKNIKKQELDLESVYDDYVTNNDQPHSHKKFEKVLKLLQECDLAINCTGIIKPLAAKNPSLTLFINGAFPHILSDRLKDKLIHVTTDCVFDGVTNPPYDENSQKTSNDLYGLSKSSGEPSASLVIRTSFIGPELGTKNSFLEWLKSCKGKKVDGYVNHFWNGITTKEFGKICHKVIYNRKKFPDKGIFHIFSDAVSKYEMVTSINRKYDLGLTICKRKVNPIDRRLSSIHTFCRDLEISSFYQMIEEL